MIGCLLATDGLMVYCFYLCLIWAPIITTFWYVWPVCLLQLWCVNTILQQFRLTSTLSFNYANNREPWEQMCILVFSVIFFWNVFRPDIYLARYAWDVENVRVRVHIDCPIFYLDLNPNCILLVCEIVFQLLGTEYRKELISSSRYITSSQVARWTEWGN
jgi:hypothetical protein